MTQGLDFSWGRPGGAAIKAAGFDFAIRYVPFPGDGGHGLTVAEVTDYHANKVAIAMVFETTEGRALEGYQAGRYDATVAKPAMQRLGFPDDRPCYFAVDVNVDESQWPLIDSYLGGCASVMTLARVGVYGEADLIDHCFAAGTAAWGWQAAATSWSNGRRSKNLHLRQYRNGQTLNGAAVDYNEAYTTDFGQWPVTWEEDMTDDDLLAIFAGDEEVDIIYDERGRETSRTLKPREERLRLAKDRRDQAAAGKAPSVRDLAASALALAANPVSPTELGTLRARVALVAEALERAAKALRG